MTLLHITTRAAWAAGRIDPAGGDSFVHLSRPDQVHVPANLLYAGRTDLVLLAIDPRRVAGDVREEGGFPHLYAAVTTDAVFDVLALQPDDDGVFRLVFAPVPAVDPTAAALIEDMVLEMQLLYGARIDGADMPSATPADFAEPAGTFLVGHLDGEPVAGGGVKSLGDGVAEIKRMYVTPDVRNRGVARQLLEKLEAAAHRRGHSRVRLDTGPKQPQARHLYESAGYREIANYNNNPRATFFGEKLLTAPAR